jgi:hypothetical protein
VLVPQVGPVASRHLVPQRSHGAQGTRTSSWILSEEPRGKIKLVPRSMDQVRTYMQCEIGTVTTSASAQPTQNCLSCRLWQCLQAFPAINVFAAA